MHKLFLLSSEILFFFVKQIQGVLVGLLKCFIEGGISFRAKADRSSL